MTVPRQYLTVHDVQAVTKLSKSASYELMWRLGAIKLGRATRLLKERLDSHLSQLERPHRESGAELPLPVATEAPKRTPKAPKPPLSENRKRLARIFARVERERRMRQGQERGE